MLLFTGFDPQAFPGLRLIRGKVAAYNMHLRAIAQRRGCRLVDLWSMTMLADPREWSPDRLHLAPDGHRRVALLACEVIGAPVSEDWREPLPPGPRRRLAGQVGDLGAGPGQRRDVGPGTRGTVAGPAAARRLRRRRDAAQAAPAGPGSRFGPVRGGRDHPVSDHRAKRGALGEMRGAAARRGKPGSIDPARNANGEISGAGEIAASWGLLRVRTASGERADSALQPAAPAGLVEYAVGQLLNDGDAVDALPAVLGRLATALHCRAALAFQQAEAGSLVVLAAHPQRAAADGPLLAELGELCAARAFPARDGGAFQEPLDWPGQADGAGGAPMTVLMAHSGAADSCLCAIALIGDGSAWTAETRSMAHAITAIVAAQIRHANDKAKLAEGQALTSALIEGSPDAIVVTGPDRRIVTFNPAAEALFDRRRADVLGQELEDLLLPERHRAEFAAGIRSYLESGDRGIYVGSMRYPAMRPDGTERMVELTPVPITVDGVVHFCGFMRDISELELAHAALADSETRFRVLAQLAPVGMVQMDAGGLCTFANDRWCEMTGMTAADADRDRLGLGTASRGRRADGA